MTNKRVKDIGEFELLRKVIFPIIKMEYSGSIGDDAANVTLPAGPYDLIVTTDGPITPIATQFGINDLYYHGWYTVLNNVSDLAAVGSIPLCYCSSIRLPETLDVKQVKRLFKGISDACKIYKVKNAGGNLKNGREVECHGTAIGYVQKGKKIGRGGCKDGDIIVTIGGGDGLFIHSYLTARIHGMNKLKPDERNALLKPRAKIREMGRLNTTDYISAASDNSDGLLGSIKNISDSSLCKIILDMNPAVIPKRVRRTAHRQDYNPFNLFFFWGDWQIVAAVKKSKWNSFKNYCRTSAIAFKRIGIATSGRPGIYGLKEGKPAALNILRNENFTSRSFNKNPFMNINYLLKGKLFK